MCGGCGLGRFEVNRFLLCALKRVDANRIVMAALMNVEALLTYFKAEEPVIKSLRQLATSNALHACATSDQTKWHLLPCDLKPTKLVNACRPMCCGSHATPVP